ncbi:39S ribosomal protein L10, mitochondrial isoform X2 [Chelonia mydas]|uniref:39S ribosomal protein L10, mitochondrial isoform X2 n=1 Tax=Chelonia mydas TaxID=8469 RepID=UPI0018A1EA9C|nr:39S ribosomal protein L10, mitochondrial isoform X2 [Chelonia mydas]
MAAAALCCRGPCRTGWLPTLQIVRHAKSVTRHWKAMHFERQKLMAVTEYIAPKPAIPEKCVTPYIRAIKEENGYAKLLRRQVTETFRDSKMIAVCQHNFMPSEEMLLMKHRLRKHNIHVKFFPNEIVRPYLSVSKYKNLLPLFVGCSLMLVSPEIKAKEMLRILKNVPQISLLAGARGVCVNSVQWQPGWCSSLMAEGWRELLLGSHGPVTVQRRRCTREQL